jgi:hypothetical protein
MNKNFTKEEIFRLYEQSEFSDLIYGDGRINKKLNRFKTEGNKFPFFYTLVSAGALVGAISFFTILKKYKLFRFL